MAKHTRPEPVMWGRRLAYVVLALVVGIAIWGGISLLLDGPGDSGSDDLAIASDAHSADAEEDADAAPATDAAAAEPGECGLATVWAAPEIAPAVEAAVARATDDCAEYAVVSRSAASSQSALRGGETPDVWIPSSTA